MRATESSSRRSGLQPHRHGLQKFIADRVSERVVDHLEAIEIEEHHRERMFQPARMGQRDGQTVAKEPAVRKAGQRIVIGLILDVLLDRFSLGDVAGDADDFADCRRRRRRG